CSFWVQIALTFFASVIYCVSVACRSPRIPLEKLSGVLINVTLLAFFIFMGTIFFWLLYCYKIGQGKIS
ncbi:hypothetical protein, partial [Microcoleus sp. Pol7_B1]|uniref:hypothetical protein n=1 Tax=Microcoleus sp. Pol7_B1 TaxID=2818894 RepID=UPI002FD66D32